ncbi:TlpA family protein disulfide reductase [Sulfurimonas sp. MAG313]|nr:TlpA disulfide reductase family protein [Sulfurimonas sp. MAG313]MDF1879773.1 TlpA family protein disulfide reductase [Sulfurimonas sp. MAG313]
MSLKNLFISLSVIFLLGACSDSSQEELSSLVSQSVYHLKDLKNVEYKVIKEGNDFTVEGMSDKVILFDIFATWCPPCRAAAPNLSKLQDKFKNDVKIIGVLIEEDKSNAYVQRFVDTYGAEYSISNTPDNHTLSRAIAATTDVGQGFPIPLMVMFYKGKYINHYIGVVPEEMIENDIKKVMGK